MNNENFEKSVSELLSRIEDNLIVKAREYATGDNRLHNFDRGAAVTGQTRERVLFGFALKHLISVMYIIDDLDKGKIPSKHMVDEKVGDLTTYMTLLYASLSDRLSKHE